MYATLVKSQKTLFTEGKNTITGYPVVFMMALKSPASQSYYDIDIYIMHTL